MKLKKIKKTIKKTIKRMRFKLDNKIRCSGMNLKKD